jgi:hypothetical protein
MQISPRLHLVFRPLDRWGLGYWPVDAMAHQVCSEAEARGERGPTRETVVQRLKQLGIRFELRLGPWALIVLSLE